MRYPIWLPLLLGFLTAVGPLSTDMYLPAFPAIEASLGGRPGTAQVTLATWFAGLAVSQLTLLVWRLLPDTLPVNRRVPLGLVNLATRYSAVARDLVFLSSRRGGSALLCPA